MGIVFVASCNAWTAGVPDVASLHLLSICTSRSETYVKQLGYLDGNRAVPKAIMGDERIRTLGDPWHHAIGNVIAAPGTERRPPRSTRSTLRGVATIPSYSTTDISSFFDQCASTG